MKSRLQDVASSLQTKAVGKARPGPAVHGVTWDCSPLGLSLTGRAVGEETAKSSAVTALCVCVCEGCAQLPASVQQGGM